MKLYVNYFESGDETYDPGSGEWDHSWSYQGTFSVESVLMEQPSGHGYETFDVGFSINQGQEVYVLSMIYSTGDSFGHANGKGEILWVFKDLETAKKAATKLREQENEYSVKIEDEEGQTITLSNPGSGYFESVEEIRLDTFTVGKAGSYKF